MDFIIAMPKSKGFDALLVVVDRLSKYRHFVLIKHPYSEVLNRTLETYLRCFCEGFPK